MTPETFENLGTFTRSCGTQCRGTQSAIRVLSGFRGGVGAVRRPLPRPIYAEPQLHCIVALPGHAVLQISARIWHSIEC
jgi:hypothetical protein